MGLWHEGPQGDPDQLPLAHPHCRCDPEGLADAVEVADVADVADAADVVEVADVVEAADVVDVADVVDEVSHWSIPLLLLSVVSPL